MADRENVLNDLNVAKNILCNTQMLTPEMCLRVGQVITSAIDLLKEQEPIEPKTGKWITRIRHEHYPSGKPYEEDFCSECGKRGSLEYPFCPWCGIKMESGKVG